MARIAHRTHIATLEKFIQRQATATDPRELAHLEILIGAYTRLYVDG